LTAAMTSAGLIIGTAAYMSPEQARGHEVDRRTDIWAFGCQLFELLTAKRAFAGGTVSDTLASVLKSDPPWEALPPEIPRPLLRLLHRCLDKDPRRRLHDIADARVEIEDLLAGRSVIPEPATDIVSEAVAKRPLWILPVAVAVTLCLGLIGGRLTVTPEPPAPQPLHRLSMRANDFVPRTGTGIARDGSAFVYPARSENAVWHLMIRRLDRFEAEPLEGTDYAINPFFSPDGQWVVFARDDVVRKLPASGGPTQPVCNLRGEMTGFWGDDGFIYLTGTWDETDRVPAICRVPENGGTPEVLVLASAAGENFYDPFLLPDGKTLLFCSTLRSDHIEALDLTTGSRKPVMEGAAFPIVTSAGQLVYYDNRVDRIFSVPFDTETMEPVGSPIVLVDQVTVFSVAPTGMVIYAPGTVNSDDVVVRVTRDGAWTPLVEEPSSWAQPRFSPDGASLLIRKTASPNCYLWRYDLQREVLSRVTFENDSHDAAWSPDGNQIAFCATGELARTLFTMPADGSGTAQPRSNTGNVQQSVAWSPDGSHIIYAEITATTAADLWYIAAGDSAAKPEVFLQTDFTEDHASFSPDGRWVAYTSDESGSEEIYLRRFPDASGKIRVSREGGGGALWSPDSRELFYASGDRLMVVDVTLGENIQLSAPRELFTGDFAFERVGNYDIAPDGQSFVVVRSERGDEGERGFHVVSGDGGQ